MDLGVYTNSTKIYLQALCNFRANWEKQNLSMKKKKKKGSLGPVVGG